jgi:GT2 family glycosyltransferase
LSLRWSLAISTYNRGEILLEAIRLSIAQSLPPIEIIVVDASNNWQKTRDLVSAELVGTPILLKYEQAAHRSSAAQRNQAMSLSSGDILFLLDDDSFMYPDCAETIVQLYENDMQQSVVAIGAYGVARSPSEQITSFETKVTGATSAGPILKRLGSTAVGNFVVRKLLMMQYEEFFLPYKEAAFSKPQLPKNFPAISDVFATNTIPGYALTVRRSVALRYLFDQSLRYYAPLEDADFCHRIQSDGALIVARKAKVHHFQAASGRMPRDKVIALQILNMAVFLRKHATDITAKRRAYRIMLARRVVAEFLKDLFARRLSFPQLRGVIQAARYYPAVFNANSEAELDEIYPHIQATILGR